jgi:hypothetical protein
LNYQVKEDEMGGACSTHAYRVLLESRKERDHKEDLDVGGNNIKMDLTDGVVSTGLVWLRIGTSGGFL